MRILKLLQNLFPRTYLAALIGLFVFQSPSTAAATFRTEPYLQNVSPTGITIMWELTSQSNCLLQYGPNTSLGSEIIPEETTVQSDCYVYKALLNELESDTSYYYRVLINGEPAPIRSFTTAPRGIKTFSFGVWGDSQGTNHNDFPDDPLEPTKSIFAHMAQHVDIAISAGDLAENGNSLNDTRRYYLDRVAKYLGPKVPWFNAWGNHDAGPNGVIRQFADMPSKYRGNPFHAGYGSFSFEYAGCHFICIDYQDEHDFTWIENDFIKAVQKNARFIFVFVHRGPYYERWYDGEAVMRENLVPLMEKYGVDICFSGHTHTYERGYKNGVYYCVTGGGSWLDYSEPLVRDWEHMTVGGYHDLEAEIDGGLVHEYVQVHVDESGFTATMIPFHPDGSIMAGVTDTFAKKDEIADINHDGQINFMDAGILSRSWLRKNSDPLLKVVPNIIGLTETEARSALQFADLAVGDITTSSSNTLPAGKIISQDPCAGTNVELASPVDFVISEGIILFSENFDSLPLEPNIWESLADSTSFTHTPPSGWIIDNSGVPTIGIPSLGVPEWEGWSFTDPQWWTAIAGDQGRSGFSKGSGVIAVADPDEWDDLGNPGSTYTFNSYLSTPAIDISGRPENSLVLIFDSSWRPEDTQTAAIHVSYNDGAPIEVFRWDSINTENYKPDATNETVTLPLNNPAGASQLKITFGLFNATNDWWWAIDNIKVSVTE